jgi:hypothetical protein
MAHADGQIADFSAASDASESNCAKTPEPILITPNPCCKSATNNVLQASVTTIHDLKVNEAQAAFTKQQCASDRKVPLTNVGNCSRKCLHIGVTAIEIVLLRPGITGEVELGRTCTKASGKHGIERTTRENSAQRRSGATYQQHLQHHFQRRCNSPGCPGRDA